MTHSDRRRIIIVTLLTLLALPTAWWLNKRTEAQSSDPGPTRPPATVYQPQVPIFLDIDTAPEAINTLAHDTGPPPQANRVLTKASYRQLSPGVCVTLLAPLGVRLTVTNVDTGQKMTCRTTTGSMNSDGVGLVIHTNDFGTLGDLADSPVHVRITW